MENESNSIEDILSNYIMVNCLPKNYTTYLDYDMNLFDAGILDSAGLISYLSFMEMEFHITIPDEDLLPENFSTINKITEYIRTQQKE